MGRRVVPDGLRAAGLEVVVHDDVFPPGTPDEVWLTQAGRNGWIVLTKDKRIRYRGIERDALNRAGVAAFVLTAKNMTGDEWYRIDLLFFHRRLRCLVVIDLKVGKFTPDDAGQMNVYLNYARERWTQPGENPPVGLILAAEKNEALARYALEGLASEVMAREYRLVLPDEKRLVAEIEATRERWESRSGR